MSDDLKIKSHWNESWISVAFQSETKSCDYAISNYGRIKSVNKSTGKEAFLKGAIVNRGLRILNVKLKDNATGYAYIHKFVAEYFVEGQSTDQNCVIHTDFDKNNNKWNNLKWVTEKEWKEHVKKSPVYQKGREKRMKNYKLTETKVKMMKKMLVNKQNKRKIIARKFNVSESLVRRIEKGEYWSQVTIDDKNQNSDS
jgi:hypothetical protein